MTPTAPAVREVTIVGAPENVQIGQTAQLRAAARADDGIQDVTGQASWQSSDSSVCAISAAGIVEGRGAGTATLTASYSGVSGLATVSCGFVINVLVHENAPTTDVVLPGTRVEVAGGPLDRRSFVTDGSGRVALPPVAGPGFALYFKKPGYDDRRVEILEFPRHTTLDVWIYREPVVQLEYSGQCGASPGYRTVAFTMPREGRMRLWVSSAGFSTFASILAFVRPVAPFADSVLRASTGDDPTGDRILDPGNYELYFEGTDCLNKNATWTVRLDFPR